MGAASVARRAICKRVTGSWELGAGGLGGKQITEVGEGRGVLPRREEPLWKVRGHGGGRVMGECGGSPRWPFTVSRPPRVHPELAGFRFGVRWIRVLRASTLAVH
jgi:hypothetical protein